MSIREYEIVVTEKGPKKVELNIKIGKGDFPPLTHLVFKSMGIEGVQESEESTDDRTGQFIPSEIIEESRRQAIEIMIKESTKQGGDF